MNNFLKKRARQNFLSKVIVANYGYGFNFHQISSLKMNSTSLSTVVSRQFLEQNYPHFNKLLRIKEKENLETTKKQSSWKGLRLRQGLPLRGQRTHTNSRSAKKLVPSLIHRLS